MGENTAPSHFDRDDANVGVDETVGVGALNICVELDIATVSLTPWTLGEA